MNCIKIKSFVEFPKDIKKLYFVLVVLEKKRNFARDLKDVNRGVSIESYSVSL